MRLNTAFDQEVVLCDKMVYHGTNDQKTIMFNYIIQMMISSMVMLGKHCHHQAELEEA